MQNIWDQRIAQLQAFLPETLDIRILDNDGVVIAGGGEKNSLVGHPGALGRCIFKAEAEAHAGAHEGVLLALDTVQFVLELAGPTELAMAFSKVVQAHANIQFEDASRYERMLLAKSDPAIFLERLDGKFLISTRAHDVLWGQEGIGMAGRFAGEIYGDELAEEFAQSDCKVVAAGREFAFKDVIVSQGQERTYLVRKLPVTNAAGEIFAVGGVGSDITEAKAKASKLKEKEAPIQKIIDNAPSAIVIKSPDGVITLSNKAHDDLWKKERGSLVGKREIDYVLPEYAANFAASDCEILVSTPWSAPPVFQTGVL